MWHSIIAACIKYNACVLGEKDYKIKMLRVSSVKSEPYVMTPKNHEISHGYALIFFGIHFAKTY
jgi:hypothetical protein